jgi:hypothetical protein
MRVSGNRVLKKILGLKRDKLTEGWRKLLNEELHDLYPSPGIILIMSRRMGWKGHAA